MKRHCATANKDETALANTVMRKSISTNNARNRLCGSGCWSNLANTGANQIIEIVLVLGIAHIGNHLSQSKMKIYSETERLLSSR